MWDSSPVGFWVNTKAFSYAWLQFTFSTSWLFPSRRWLHFLCYTVLLFKLHSEEGRALHKKCKKVVHHWRKKCCNGIKSTLEFFEFKNCCEGIWSMYSICTQGCTMYSDRVPTTSLPKKVLAKCKITKVLFRHFVTHIKKVTIHSALPPQNTGFVYPMGTTTKLQRWKSALFCTIKLQLAFGYL